MLGLPPSPRLPRPMRSESRFSRVSPLHAAIVAFIFGSLYLNFSNNEHVRSTLAAAQSSKPISAIHEAISGGHEYISAKYASAIGSSTGAGRKSGISIELDSFARTAAAAAKGQDTKQKYHLVLPVTSASHRFCRSLFALLVNGYDAPTIINWGGSTGQYHYAKITAALEWLQSGGSDDDIVLTIDAHDVWPQLPADVFFEQYSKYPTGAKIGAEKRCYPPPDHHPRCKRLPESPLPIDVYGNRTDKINRGGAKGSGQDVDPIWDGVEPVEWGMYETIRPRYINSGTIVGTRKELTMIYNEALAKMNRALEGKIKTGRLGSDQEIFALVNLDHMEEDDELVLTPDVHMRLFQTMGNSYKDVVSQPLFNSIEQLPKDQQEIMGDLAKAGWSGRSLVTNRWTKAIPSLMHFSGAKEALDVWWRKMWWMQPDPDSRSLFTSWKISSPTPLAEKYFNHFEANSQQYGIRLDNGTWFGWNDICTPHRRVVLGHKSPPKPPPAAVPAVPAVPPAGDSV